MPSFDGLVSGLGTSSIIEQLMSLEALPQQRLIVKRNQARVVNDTYRAVITAAGKIKSAAADLSDPRKWNALTATSSNESILTASGGEGAAAGSVSLKVLQLAQSGGASSAGTVAGLAAPVVSGGTFALAQGLDGSGIVGVDDTGAGIGSFDLQVDQASAAATSTGGPIGGSVTVGPGNNTIDVTVNGAAQTITLADGTYTAEQLAAEISSASGGTVAASAAADGALSLSTVTEGSASTIQVTGGTALGDLNLAVDGAANTGTDAVVTVDGVATTLSFISDGSSQALAGGLTITTGAGLREADNGTVNVLDAGDGTLSDVTAAIQAAKIGINAAAVDVGGGQYRLQLSSATSGEGTGIIGGDAFAPIGGLNSVAGQDAQVQLVGSTDVISSDDNSFAGLLPGVTIDVKSAAPDTVVTVASEQDADLLADRMQAFVDQVNATLDYVSAKTAYSDGSTSPLAGDRRLRSFAAEIRGAITAQFGDFAGRAGLEITREGKAQFNRSEFLDALAEDPDAVRDTFAEAATVPAGVTFTGASAETDPGTYNVAISAYATRAELTGAAFGSLAGTENVTVTIGSTTASVELDPGATAQDAADALNDMFEDASMAAVAFVDGSGQVVLRSESYGSAQTLTVTSDSNALGLDGTSTGSDVQGTINGEAFTGTGQTVRVDNDSAEAPGLRFKVTDSAAATFDITYTPGTIASAEAAIERATRTGEGILELAIESRELDISRLDDSIDQWEDRLARREQMLRRRFAAMENILGQLQDSAGQLLAALPTTQQSSGQQ